MHIHFYKYHGAGNDFIIADNRDNSLTDISSEQIRQMCSRRFGIGSDGFIFLSTHNYADFQMDFYNPDGSGATFCGNGARCIVAFAYRLGIIKNETEFMASDGLHKAVIKDSENTDDLIIRLRMSNVESLENHPAGSFCNTGAPHLVQFTKLTDDFPVVKKGREIRFSDKYKTDGINVNFVSALSVDQIYVRTYERGVEDETLSCGTGVTASALAFAQSNDMNEGIIGVKTRGGNFRVGFKRSSAGFSQVYLQGPAVFVYGGEIEV
jgi:diaminopimelate epimerase